MGAVIVSAGILRQVGKDRVAHTPRSRVFRKDEMAGYTYQMAYVLRYIFTSSRSTLITLAHTPFDQVGKMQSRHFPSFRNISRSMGGKNRKRKTTSPQVSLLVRPSSHTMTS